MKKLKQKGTAWALAFALAIGIVLPTSAAESTNIS